MRREVSQREIVSLGGYQQHHGRQHRASGQRPWLASLGDRVWGACWLCLCGARKAHAAPCVRLRGAPLTIANLHSPFFVRPLPRHLRQIGVKHDDLRPDETVVRMLRLMSFVRATARQTMIPSRLPFQRHSSPLLLGGLAATSDSLARLASCSP